MSSEQRERLMLGWLEKVLGTSQFGIAPASSDASFRRYFRVTLADKSYIVMDAPPSHEDVRPFIKVTKLFSASGIHVPGLHGEDQENGFLLLDDLGSCDYLSELNNNSVTQLYDDAIETLLTLQHHCVGDQLPPYDEELLQREMGLFTEWYLQRHLQLQLSEEELLVLRNSYSLLIENALAQPKVCVHRDYHSRNLMVCDNHNPGVLDYQDAVHGPITYDLVSLLRDCYIRWPISHVYTWVREYHQKAHRRGLLECDERQFIEWFDLMGMQRHLKAVGIFARLYHRDNKPGYLDDIPRTLGYIQEVVDKYPCFSALKETLLNHRVWLDSADNNLAAEEH